MANKTGGNYRALYVPEQLSRETYNSLLQEPSIQEEVLTLISRPNCVVHSIGRALHIWRHAEKCLMTKWLCSNKNAVARIVLVISFDERKKWSIKSTELVFN